MAIDKIWPSTDLAIMLQSELVGRPQEAYTALSVEDHKYYMKVKAQVRKAFELVPEAYRFRFHTWKKIATNPC